MEKYNSRKVCKDYQDSQTVICKSFALCTRLHASARYIWTWLFFIIRVVFCSPMALHFYVIFIGCYLL